MNTEPAGRGIVCFTFDDGRFSEWLPQLKLFEKYHAHMSFFYNGDLRDGASTDSMKILRDAGHTVGLHARTHRDAVPAIAEEGAEAYLNDQIVPQIKACREAGLEVHSFAYPNNRRDDETDRVLGRFFRHFRAGLPSRPAKGFRIAEQSDAFTPLSRIRESPVFGGCGIGEYYASTLENLFGGLERAARENARIVFFSHGISTSPRAIDVHADMLEALLRRCAELGLVMAGMDEF